MAFGSRMRWRQVYNPIVKQHSGLAVSARHPAQIWIDSVHPWVYRCRRNHSGTNYLDGTAFP